MTPLEIIGLKSDLPAVVHSLQRLGCVQIGDLNDLPGSVARPLATDRETTRTQEALKLTATKVDGLLTNLLGADSPYERPGPGNEASRQLDDCLAQAQDSIAELTPQVQSLIFRRGEFQDELDALPRYEATLRKLLPIVPRAASVPGNVSIAILVSKTHGEVLDHISRQASDLTGGRAEATTGEVDDSTRAMLLVFPREFTTEIESFLGRKDVSRLRLPPRIGSGQS